MKSNPVLDIESSYGRDFFLIIRNPKTVNAYLRPLHVLQFYLKSAIFFPKLDFTSILGDSGFPQFNPEANARVYL